MAAAGSSTARSSTAWTAADDAILVEARKQGLSWQPIAQKHFPSKTANACRKRHERLMERQNAEDWDGIKLEALATAYMQCRQQMWSILGDQVGEKWSVVENKCMEKGYKNLQAAHRSAQRKERGISEGDSGIDVQDAENDIDDSPSSTHQAPFAQGSYRGQQRAGMSIQTMLSPSPNAHGHAGPSHHG